MKKIVNNGSESLELNDADPLALLLKDEKLVGVEMDKNRER